ncbi:ABC transporter permease [Streptomyces sp. NRRL F-5053]|uniref:ABC transporter permease n=1 Tax=Streptomyces sp. NRRL F-5053 TaxID=1463854 RepID=UPI0004C5C0D2|nr:ABC transporter permease [Streptomyces sp. NRRL F-5053]
MTRFILSRMRAHRLLVSAALLSVVLATCLLAALTAFSTALGDAGLRRALERAPGRTVLDIRSDVTARQAGRTDDAVRRAAHDAYGGLPVTVRGTLGSAAYALPRSLHPRGTPAQDAQGTPGGQADDPDLTRFASLDRSQVRMVEGTWPRAARGSASAPRVQAAVEQRAATRLGLEPGDTFRVRSRLDGPPDVHVTVTGIWAPRSAGSPYWRLDPLRGKGIAALDYTTYGPLTVPAASFADGPGGTGPLPPAEARWQARADLSSVTAADLGRLRTTVRDSTKALGSLADAPHTTATSELPGLLDELERSLLVTRSTLLVAALQLALLTGVCLLLVARLLWSERAGEDALLRARGASARRVAALAAAEALLLALPAAVAAPLLAGPAVRLLTAYGPLARAGVEPVTGLPPGSRWAAAGAALGCALLLLLPALRRRATEDGPAHQPVRTSPRAFARGRRTAATVLRGGADLALVALAGVAYWQLRQRADGAGVLADEAGGTLGIDPVLVAAPALALLAGAVLVLRVLPAAARLGERLAARGRGLAGALAGWQLARRPLRGAGPALLLVLAVATGVFALGQGAGWDRSQDDQADFRTGADLSVSGAGTPPLAQGGLFDSVPGIAATAPVARTDYPVEGGRSVQVLATDTRQARPGLPLLREDLSPRPLRELLRPLAGPDAGTSRTAGIRLPADARELRLRLRLSDVTEHGDGASDGGDDHDGKGSDGGGSRGEGSGSDSGSGSGSDGDAAGEGGGDGEEEATLLLTVEDRYGVPYRLLLGDIPADGRAHSVHTALARSGGTPAGPLRLTRLALSWNAPTHDRERQLTVERLTTTGPHGTRTVHAPHADRWKTRLRTVDPGGTLGSGGHADPTARPARTATGDTALTFRHTTGSAPPPIPYKTEPALVTAEATAPGAAGVAATGDAPLPALATDAYLRTHDAHVGDTATAQISGEDLTVRITGSVRALPTVRSGDAGDRPGAGALMFDLAALDRALADRDGTLLEPRTWWVATRDGATAHVARALRDQPALGAVHVRDETADALHTDPLGAGPRSALSAVAVAAAVLAATGFAVSTAAAARTRAREHAVLRALGTSRRRLTRALVAEQGLLIGLSAVLGLALGALITHLFVPLVTLTAQARPPVPTLLVDLPAGPLAALLAATLAVPLLAVAATATALRRTDPVTALRTERGE